jgi:hypothetical protein
MQMQEMGMEFWEQFFTYYTKVVEGIQPENIFNHDKTNL